MNTIGAPVKTIIVLFLRVNEDLVKAKNITKGAKK
jgi:hypothetical protein